MERNFLDGAQLRPVKLDVDAAFEPVGLALGQGNQMLEVLVCKCKSAPANHAVKNVWKARNGGRAAPLVLVILYGDRTAFMGPTGEDPPFSPDVDRGQLERLCHEALGQPDRHSALRSLRDSLGAIESGLPGIRNEGFLAIHELSVGARLRGDWAEAETKSQQMLSLRGSDLLTALGYSSDKLDNVTSILRSGDQKLALAVLLNESESPELQSDRFSSLSPVSYALAVADRENLPYVIVCHGPKIRLYPTKAGVGVGRRGRTETFIECHTGLLRDNEAAYLPLVFSAEAIAENGSLSELIEDSSRFAGELAENLRDRIYGRVVPALAQGIADARKLHKPTAQDLEDTYAMAMVTLFRLLFIAYAEDKDLLPYRWSDTYKRRSIKTKAQELLEFSRQNDATFGEETSHWQEMCQLFKAISEGNHEWSVPAYNGGMFSTDAAVSKAGNLLNGITLPNTVMGPVLTDLLLIESAEGLGPVDFRSLGVREFGTVYEGLLESELSVAETDLTIDKNGNYIPCPEGTDPIVTANDIYIHNRSGARKASGSYYTKTFAVEHLLQGTLDPALKDHLVRLDALDDKAASEQFFDFRAADIAMGSGHFLVTAIDHIEKELSGYLYRRSLPGVHAELRTLRESARNELGFLADQIEIEDTQLIRRMIARRCIYGVDINPIAVQLARLGIWIHTFVPGLPLSFLDHNLVCGNSLVGIGEFSEIRDKLIDDAADLPLFGIDPSFLLGEAEKPLERLARLSDATLEDIQRAREAAAEVEDAICATRTICDMVTVSRVRGEALEINREQLEKNLGSLFAPLVLARYQEDISQLKPFHFPIAFPEVFLRSRCGFDVIFGNPPWEKAKVEEHIFWTRHFPGFRALPQAQLQVRKAELQSERPDLVAQYEAELKEAENLRIALTAGTYPGMGTGDPDLYKAFCWRFWHLTSKDGGRIGVVLPRMALSGKGMTEFRDEVLQGGSLDVTMTLNTRGWVFDEAEHRYTIGLVAIEKRKPEGLSVSLRGPYTSLERLKAGMLSEPSRFSADDVNSWNDTASLPLLPNEKSVEVFAQLRKSPRLDVNNLNSWRTRPVRELDATNDKKYMDVISETCPEGFWPVFKGESLDMWKPDTGTYYAWGDPNKVIPVLQKKRLRGNKLKKSAFSEMSKDWARDPDTLPCLKPRIAFRDITNRTNKRTLIAALVPPNVFISHTAPFLLFPRSNIGDEAYLLGVLSSIPLDWYARRFVETHVTYFVFNPFPVPRPDLPDPLHERVVALAGRLAAPDDRFAEWADSNGVDCGAIEPNEKQDMIHELDAVVAHLYGLEEKHLIHVFETFHEGWDYQDRLDATLVHFQRWMK